MNVATERRIDPRKTPQQQRSIQRLEAILAAASGLIAKKGVAGLKMIEIAATAGVPIGSLYQFFPEKVAILRALHDRYTAHIEEDARRVFCHIDSIEAAGDLLDRAIDDFYRTYRADPTYLPLWLAAISDPDLAALNQAHIDRLAGILFVFFSRLLPPEGRVDLEARLVLFIYLTGALVRYAMGQDCIMARRLVAEWRSNVRRTLFAI
jgi:AcrR family transcriptional regulator